MLIELFPRFLAIALIAWPMPHSPQDSTPLAAGQPTQQTENSAPGSAEKQEPETVPPERPSQSDVLPKPPFNSRAQAWQLLDAACASQRTSTRASAVGALRLLPRNARARGMAEKALTDEKPEVRSAAAASLGAMGAKASISKLRDATSDPETAVVLAAAHSLIGLHDQSGYEVYYEILTGERKGKKGLIASQTAILKDPKKLAALGLQEGIGFIPYGGMGWEAVKVIREGDSSSLRAAAAKTLTQDPDPATATALEEALTDKHWQVRAAALEALADREDPSVLDAVAPYLYDEKNVVKYTAAAAVLRLYSVEDSRTRSKRQGRKAKPIAGKTSN